LTVTLEDLQNICRISRKGEINPWHSPVVNDLGFIRFELCVFALQNLTIKSRSFSPMFFKRTDRDKYYFILVFKKTLSKGLSILLNVQLKFPSPVFFAQSSFKCRYIPAALPSPDTS
jgi:hypothetical protein